MIKQCIVCSQDMSEAYSIELPGGDVCFDCYGLLEEAEERELNS